MSTILLVDDEPEILELYSELLELMGHDILRAHDGVQALGVARRLHPDLVVTDWMMPRMDGVELCRELSRSEELRDIPIVMHSGSGDPHAPGVRAFLPKGSALERFAEMVTRTLTMGTRPRRSRGAQGESVSVESRH
ncbi:response regulator [Archangium sp.]|uniref:response regulator n=1 Tax=Archangium sp. TaxID=1872627 RepID=UPI002ED949A6